MPSRLWFGACLLVLTTSCSGDDDASPGSGGGQAASGGTGGSGQTTGGSSGSGQLTAGSGGQSTGGSSGHAAGGMPASAGQAPTLDYPTDTTAEGIQAFIDAASYRTATWASGMKAPEDPPMDTLSPHGHEYIWYNHALRQSNSEGHTGTSSATGSMAVKEIYTGESVVGHAAMLRTDTKWIMFCLSSESDRCFAGAPANTVTYTSSITNCGCHGGGTIITAPQMPPP